MTDFSQIRSFVLTVELRSIVAAARRLGLSPAAVSKQLSRLENDLGVQLLIRTTRHIELTDIGKSYYTQCQRILDEVNEAKTLIDQSKAIPSGPLRVVAPPHFAKMHIIPCLPQFLALYPKIELNLELAERIPDLQNEPIDLLIGMSISAGDDAIQRTIGSTTYVICAAPKYLHQHGTPQNLIELLHHRHITHSRRQPYDSLCIPGKEPIAITPYLQANDTETMLALALEAIGIVMLHRYVVEEHLLSGALIQLLPSFTNSAIPLYLAYPHRRFLASKTRLFIDFVVEKL